MFCERILNDVSLFKWFKTCCHNNFCSLVQAPENIKDGAVLVRSGESLLLNFANHLRLTSTSSDIESIKIAVQVRCFKIV